MENYIKLQKEKEAFAHGRSLNAPLPHFHIVDRWLRLEYDWFLKILNRYLYQSER
jgi:hypothetical protein